MFSASSFIANTKLSAKKSLAVSMIKAGYF